MITVWTLLILCNDCNVLPTLTFAQEVSCQRIEAVLKERHPTCDMSCHETQVPGSMAPNRRDDRRPR
jgi:hypothetical protein